MADGDVLIGAGWPASFGAVPSNILLKKVDGPVFEPIDVHSNQNAGKYYASKLKQTKVTYTVTVEVNEGGKAAIEALNNTGNRTSDSARLKVKFSDDNENPSEAVITGEYIDNTQENYGPKTAED